MTLNEIKFNLHNLVRGGILSDDDNLSEDQLEYIINYVRAVIIKRDIDKNKRIDPELIQDLGCVPVKLIDKSECCKILANCNILRTADKIPKPVDFNFKSGLKYVGDIDGDLQYDMSHFETIQWTQHEKYTAKLPRYFQKDGFIFVTNRDLSDVIKVRAIFEDPRKAALFSNCDGEPCYTADSEYPVSAWMVPVINDMILKNELNIVTRALNDEQNDARTKVELQTGEG